MKNQLREGDVIFGQDPCHEPKIVMEGRPVLVSKILHNVIVGRKELPRAVVKALCNLMAHDYEGICSGMDLMRGLGWNHLDRKGL